jgi:hypothetical protein
VSFRRNPAEIWHREVPGARWLKADLHLHTIDDHPGAKAKMPSGISGELDNPAVLAAYARAFLTSAARTGMQVLGLTPHCPRAGAAPETSAVWHIVDAWNNASDDDGVPFREKIYAVFPGFEPTLKEGREGLHLLFLFDPEIGRDSYLKLFDLVMGGITPWSGESLQISNKTAEEVFVELRKFRDREFRPDENRVYPWRMLVLAPHIDAPKGLLGAQKAQVLQLFEHRELAGLELGDEKLPDEVLSDRPWLQEGMKQFHHAFFHSSDAYGVSSGARPVAAQLGYRYTWVKLASPRIEAVRQAFIASDSRMRIAHERGPDGQLHELSDPPDVTVSKRPWVRAVRVRGGVSFFGGREGDGERETRFELSPDLTCLIGGSMTGKSTFLDGLRVHVDADLPKDEPLRRQVEARGRDVFLAGSPNVELDCPGRDPTAPLHEKWPAVFFAQSELQRLAQDAGAVEDILARLAPGETEGIHQRRHQLGKLDRELAMLAKRLSDLDEQVDDAEQAYQRADQAKKELAAFSEAGVERLHQAGRARQLWEAATRKGEELLVEAKAAHAAATPLEVPELDDVTRAALASAGVDPSKLSLAQRRERVLELLQAAASELEAWSRETQEVQEAVAGYEAKLRVEVERTLAKQGFDASKLKEFQSLSQQAALLASYEANWKEVRKQRASEEGRLLERQEARQRLVTGQREAFDRVIDVIQREFGGRIHARRVDCGVAGPLEGFIRALAQRGITRWWNEMAEGERPSPEILLAHIEKGTLAELGVSGPVQETFRETITRQKRRELAALRCPDLYVLELRMDDGDYRRLDELSGGQRVSVLLSLLLETTDDRPLVIDQPEDELDNRFLFDTVLPALRRLKGCRQVVVATHNANIVVNGDADMVIHLEATAKSGKIVHAGAIEQPEVRDAIVRTVDGGDEAFRLRRVKYGF